MIENIEDYNRMVAYREALKADGWTITNIYKSEPLECSCKGEKDSFVFHILTRDYEIMKEIHPWIKNSKPRRRYECAINFWGPDGLAITAPNVYSYEDLKSAMRVCSSCKEKNVDTFRYSFAGRCCADCLPAMRAQHEQPGWCD